VTGCYGVIGPVPSTVLDKEKVFRFKRTACQCLDNIIKHTSLCQAIFYDLIIKSRSPPAGDSGAMMILSLQRFLLE
jgi:hypothetical protein